MISFVIYNSKILPSTFCKYNTSLFAMLCLAPEQVQKGFSTTLLTQFLRPFQTRDINFFFRAGPLSSEKDFFFNVCAFEICYYWTHLLFFFPLLAMQLLSRYQLPLVALIHTLFVYYIVCRFFLKNVNFPIAFI